MWWAGSALAVAGAIVAVLLRRRPVGFVLALGFLAIAAGFAVATLKAALIDHPVLRYPASSVSIAGFVELREESPKTDRFVLRVERIEGNRIVDKPQRVRLSVRRGRAPPAGAFVEAKAQLNPPLPPLRPGSYDFARDLYFQRIGASGFVRGAVKIAPPPAEAGVRLRAAAFVQGVRDAIDFRIRSVLRGDTGSVASALITGKRDAISPHVYDAMFVSGIGHVLSISGYHMAVVAGVVFFFLRALLALIPGLADRAPIKKWAAFAALVVTAFYLVLSGAEVATQRSFIMIAIVLVGVMLDRPTLTMRTLTLAALLVLFFAPEAVVHPSFQDVVCGNAGAHRRPTGAACPGRKREPTVRSAPARRYGASTRSSASSSPRWSRGSRPRHTRRITSTASRPMACWPTCSPCRSSPPG